jgi:flagellar M-ring protein FliF
MDQLKKLVAGLSLKQRISIGVTAALILAAIYGFSHWRREQDFKPLYTGVAAEDAAAIIQKIKESGSDYRLSETGGVISVPSAKVAELRLEMAAAGLPKSGRIGFELFDKTTFGATEFVEHVNYNRALEGELERSIGSLNEIEQARVHLTAAKDSVFIESREPAKASVVVRLKPGAALSPQNVAAIQQLVGSAVEALNPDDVSVVDTRGNLLSRRKLSTEDDAADAQLLRRQRLEHDLVEKINATLEPLLGHDKFRAGAAVDCDITSSEQNEETFDPTKSVMVSSQKSEEVIAGGSTAGIPGTATNLPRPPARVGGPASTTSRRTENINYQSSHLVRKTRIPEGGIKRMSIAVLLAQAVRWEGKGSARKAVPIPPTPETLKVVHDLVAGVTGFDQQRGDQITVESLPFASTLEPEMGLPGSGAAGPAKPKTWKDLLKDPNMLIAAGIGAGMFLLLAAGGLVMFLRKKKKPVTVQTAPALTSKTDLAASVEEAKAKMAIESANAAEQMQAALAERMAEQQKADMAAIAALKLPTVTTKKSELLTKEIREGTKKDPSVPAHVISNWLHEG